MLYEIISPDAFLRPFMDDYLTLSSAYAVVRKAYATQVYVDRAFQRKTNDLVQEHVGTGTIAQVEELVEINAETVELIRKQHGSDARKVINLVKSIKKTALEESDDPFLLAWPSGPKPYRKLRGATANHPGAGGPCPRVGQNEQRKKEQAEKGFDALTFFVYRTLADGGLLTPRRQARRSKAPSRSILTGREAMLSYEPVPPSLSPSMRRWITWTM